MSGIVMGQSIVIAGMLWAAPAAAQGPAFDCAKASGSVEELICKDPALGALDRKLDGAFKAATAKAKGQMLATLRAEQRGWIGGRNECWKAQPNAPSSLTESWVASSARECVEAQYNFRTAELQATWRLLTPKPPVSFVCQNNPANEIVANFFDTDPPSARLERGDKTVTVFLVKSGSGARYEGRNVRFWNKGQEASVWWLNVATGTPEDSSAPSAADRASSRCRARCRGAVRMRGGIRRTDCPVCETACSDCAADADAGVHDPRAGGTAHRVGQVPRGRRRIIPILGGTFEGPNIRGKVVPGGADWQIVRADGFAELDTRYMLQTDSGQLIYIQNAGIRHAPPEVTKKLLAGEPVDPSQVYFKTVPTFETAAPELQWLTRSIFVGTGERNPAEVIIRVWRVD